MKISYVTNTAGGRTKLDFSWITFAAINHICISLTVFYGVLDCPQTIPDSIFDLCEGVFVGSLHQQRH